MILVKIGQEERPFDGRPQWIKEQLEGRRREYGNVCVQVRINCDHVNIFLSTPGCAHGPGGYRAPNGEENEILELWNRHRLNTMDFAVGNLIAFLQQVDHLCN